MNNLVQPNILNMSYFHLGEAGNCGLPSNCVPHYALKQMQYEELFNLVVLLGNPWCWMTAIQ